jgi:hypothetical protein
MTVKRVEVRSSAKRGQGVYAVAACPAGERLREIAIERELTPDAPLGPTDDPSHAFLADGKYLLVGYPDRYLNHSCDPNAYVEYFGNQLFLVARRDINPDEEICLDYLINNAGGDSWKCDCQASRCRGMTGRGFFDLPRDVQREYLPLLAPWFTRRFAAQIDALGGG